MARCERCGEENPGRARFCLGCGVPLGGAPVEERRKLATLLFCDVVGSTELGEARDPEAVRGLMASYFSLCRSCVESRGGTVEKFIGDAVMAVFGVPVAHEDDAARAVAAAIAIREGVGAMSAESTRRLGRPLQVRIGLATGEVVAGEDADRMTMATGDAVNTAARLEQAAEPGEVLVDALTAGLVAGSAECEPAGAATVKGKAAQVAVFRVSSAADRRARVGRRPEWARRRAGRFVGRVEERAALRAAFDTAVSERRGVTVTLVGEPGVGKSRLAGEAVAELDAKTVLKGTCPPYGDGLTYYPLRELLLDAGLALEDPDALAAGVAAHVGDPDAVLVAGHLARALGMSEAVSTPEDAAWAVRRLLEALSMAGPVVVLVDDLQWAEPAFTDLLRSIADLEGSPVLLICLARPELLQTQSGWPGVLSVQELPARDVCAVVGDVLGGEPDPALEAFVLARSGGNPLFAQELTDTLRAEAVIELRRGADPDPGRWVPVCPLEAVGVPNTLAGLLAARLDRTPAALRRVVECGAVEGETFHSGAVSWLSELETVEQPLAELERQAVVLPDRPAFDQETAYRFHHLLLRDAAYAALSKRRRAELHVRLAEWVTARVGPRAAEFDELIAHHLEQALEYRLTTAGPSAEDPQERRRIGAMLHRAGFRAQMRGDVVAAGKLFTRAALHREDFADDHVETLVELGQAQLGQGHLDEAAGTFDRAGARARAAGLPVLGARALIQATRVDVYLHPDGWSDRAERVLDSTADVVLRSGDETTRALLRLLETELARWRGDLSAADRASAQAADHANGAGRDDLVARILTLQVVLARDRPLAVWESRATHALRWAADRGLRIMEGNATFELADLAAQRGDFEQSRKLLAAAEALLAATGTEMTLETDAYGALLYELAGDLSEAERRLRAAFAELVARGERAHRPTVAAHLAWILAQRGRPGEAYEWTEVSEREGAPDDVENEQAWRAARAVALAQWGRRAAALALADHAMRLMSSTDDNFTAILRRWVAEACLLAGDAVRAAAAAEQALATVDRLGRSVQAGVLRDLLSRCRP